MDKIFIIEKIEKDLITLEDQNEKIYRHSKKIFPKNIKIGDVIINVNDKFVLDKERTEKRKEDMIKLQSKLFSK